MKTINNICYNNKTGQCLDIYLPENKEFSVVVYFHGGGLTEGDKSHQKCFFNYLVSQGLAVVSANYRMYPQAKYPDFIVDSASLYHIGEDDKYPPMLIIVSDNDMINRYEQTMLLVSTLKHFGHADSVILKKMNGTHCAYVNASDENGTSIFGKLVVDFINGVRA